MTRLVLVRHGETDWNREGRYTGQSDVPLNPAGMAQARKLAEMLRGESLDAIYSSDLARAKMTANAVSHAVGVEIQLDHRLREIHQGDWEGLPFKEIRRRYHQELEERRNDPLAAAPPGGETLGEVQGRVLAALKDILSAHPLGTVAIVSHGLPLAIIRGHFCGLPIEATWDHIPENATPFIIDSEEA